MGIGTWRICCCTELRGLDKVYFLGGELDMLVEKLWGSVIE